MTGLVGRGVERVDGRAKVTGAARYAADNAVNGVLHGALVMSTVARGEITELDTSAALASPGVVAVYTHENMLPLTVPPDFPYPKRFIPLQDTRIHHNGQPVAYVVAETLEQAQEAATLVRVRYRVAPPTALLADALDEAFLPRDFRGRPNETVRGDAAAALERAEVRVEQEYTSPMQHHNPIEPHTTTAVWDGDSLTLYESAQGVVLTRMVVAQAFAKYVLEQDIRVVSPYLGGGFGAKGPTWSHTLLTAAAARLARGPVKLVLTRAQMYTMNGHRAEYRRGLRLGATRQGRLTAIVDTSTAQLTRTEESIYNTSNSTLHLYACPNVHVRQLGVRLDLPTSSYMRSPETTAHFGLETALDELSYEVGLDPVELRVRNHLPAGPPASKYLLECYRMGAKAFGWARRDPRPGVTRVGDEYVGWGMATETHTYNAIPSFAELTIDEAGRATLRVASQEIGTGTYTVLTQVVADGLGMPLDHVTTLLGDTAFPAAAISAGSSTMPSVVGPVSTAARNARDAVVAIAVADPRSPLHGVPAADVVAEHGQLFVRGDRRRRDSYRDVVRRHGQAVVVNGSGPNTPGHSFGAVFVEVRVRPRLGAVRVSRVVAAYDPGRVLNHRTAHGQVIGGVTWGIGFALMEHTVVDRNTARVVNPTLSTYLVPVCADTPSVESYFVDRPDPASKPALGARGFGETPGTGVPAAISNAIFHATGRRLRDVPFTQDKLL
ncbi:xanthine dehydrogenase family protein molybdopterin-binding subunit [Actinophytocola algeriensis]|uniref:Xanthine dehydrogenase YagR molybdenum-binding subunit n=1 Tax=Actinophytocola algeriensis TaxID=1768010 RepID=A0A7W7Q7S7_9PSEU|nr:xanthine dehydrogenase family protein molybdopterin-binding subunit [Actinophytocola algeriensis]MBB4908672.1 xanthine dehydrogenase YagR molybdenum-binding subunit [Actinophytocola algeriensis]MBE1474941.1 xanthine dehydrogenase YagR molybdenum-binding subunit [Actinophytocola algeriensis]